MHQSLTIHALRPSFGMTGSAFAMIVSASPSKKVATGAAESSVSFGKTSIEPVRKGFHLSMPLGCTERLTFPKVFVFVRNPPNGGCEQFRLGTENDRDQA